MADHARDLLAEVKAELEAATPGPWGYEEAAGEFFEIAPVVIGPDGELTHDWDREVCATCSADEGGRSDAVLIAHAPEWLERLIAELRRVG